MLTDVVLEVGPELFYAHKVVLAAGSPYFKAMFTGGLRECEMNKVKLQGVCPTAMARLMNFMYTGRIRVTENTVCQLLPAATMFQVRYAIPGYSLYMYIYLYGDTYKPLIQYYCYRLSNRASVFVNL